MNTTCLRRIRYLSKMWKARCTRTDSANGVFVGVERVKDGDVARGRGRSDRKVLGDMVGDCGERVCALLTILGRRVAMAGPQQTIAAAQSQAFSGPVKLCRVISRNCARAHRALTEAHSGRVFLPVCLGPSSKLQALRPGCCRAHALKAPPGDPETDVCCMSQTNAILIRALGE